MIYTQSGADALAERTEIISPGTGNRHWGTVFFGPRSSNGYAAGPQATMSAMKLSGFESPAIVDHSAPTVATKARVGSWERGMTLFEHLLRGLSIHGPSLTEAQVGRAGQHGTLPGLV